MSRLRSKSRIPVSNCCVLHRLLQTWSIVPILLATVAIAAQSKPDFSGRWILTTRQTDVDIPSALSVRQTIARTTLRSDPMEPFFRDITIERQLETGTTSETYPIGVQGGAVPVFRADGSPNCGPTAHHAVRWEGNALVLESGSYTGGRPETGVWTERREVWSLIPDGRLSVVITNRSSGDALRHVTLVYRRP